MNKLLSERTKELFANSLKELLKTKSLIEININELSINAGSNRNTFYYHFSDKFDVIAYIIKKELFHKIEQNVKEKEYDKILVTLIDYFNKNKELAKCLYTEINQKEIIKRLKNELIHIHKDPINEYIFEKGYKISDSCVNNICELFAWIEVDYLYKKAITNSIFKNPNILNHFSLFVIPQIELALDIANTNKL